MSNGICMMLAAILLAVPAGLQAQVYRCEGASGVTYSDQPCGAGAEEIEVQGDVMDTKGVGSAVSSEVELSAPVAAALENAAAGSDGTQTLDEFLAMLRSQRQQQIGEIDKTLASLKAQLQRELDDMDPERRARVNKQIAGLEADRANILSEYAALIAEAQSRME